MKTRDAVALIYKNEIRDNDFFDLYFSKWERLEGKLDLDFTIGKTENKTYIIFESTKTYIDWLANLAYKPRNGVHIGFSSWFFVNEELINKKLREYKGTGELLILGHSLGAAYATICQSKYLRHSWGYHHSSCIVTGSPRIYTKEYSCFSCNENVTRVENGNDIVCKIPPPWYRGYQHVGKSVHIGKPKKWWKISIKDHKIENYYVNIIKEGAPRISPNNMHVKSILPKSIYDTEIEDK